MPHKITKAMQDALEKVAKKRGMMIPHSTVVVKKIISDSDVSPNGAYLADRIQGPYNDQHPDNEMKKSLDYAPYYYNNHWDKKGNYVPDKKHLIKKG